MPVGERRRALVDAAIRVIARDGVAGATTRAIVAEADMSLASLHYAFGSREELLRVVVGVVTEQEGRAALASMLPTALAADMTMADVVAAGLDRYLDLLEADPQREQALLELSLYAMRSAAPAGEPGTAAAQHTLYLHVAEEMLEQAADLTRHRWTAPLDDLARLLVTVTDGLTSTWLADRDSAATRRTARTAAATLAAFAVPVDAPHETTARLTTTASPLTTTSPAPPTQPVSEEPTRAH